MSVQSTRGSEGGADARYEPHWPEYRAEFAGTATVVFVVVSLVVVLYMEEGTLTGLPAWAKMICLGLGLGGSTAVMAYSPWGRRSGAHLNPLVTTGFWLMARMHRIDFVGYVVAQSLGGLFAMLLVAILWGPHASALRFGANPVPAEASLAGTFLRELGSAAVLMWLILTSVSRRSTIRRTPWIAGAGILVLVLLNQVPATGISLNPARSLGPAIVSHLWDGMWIHWTALPLGAALATWVTMITSHRQVICCKLYHPEEDPDCIFRHCGFRAAP